MSSIRTLVPAPIRFWLGKQRRRFLQRPPVGWVRFGSLRRVKPISDDFGFRRGLPIDRYYIEQFLSTHAADIKGHVLEFGDNDYTRKFGGDLVTKSDVLCPAPDCRMATIVADLTNADHVPSNTFDCIICIQTLPCVFELDIAMKTLYRILKPGGILLATNPGIGKVDEESMRLWGQYWRFTSLAIRRLLEKNFSHDAISIKTYGNALAATAFLQGIAAEELKEKELEYHDPDFQVSIASRAVKSILSLGGVASSLGHSVAAISIF